MDGLVSLTKPLYLVPADQRATQIEKRLVEVSPPFVPYLQPPVAVEPRQRPLDYPPVSPQPLARLDAAPGDAALDAALAQRLAAAGEVVAFVSMELLLRPLPRAATRSANRRDGVDDILKGL